MKILVTGCNGQLGHDCLGRFGARHTVKGLDLPEFDITRAESVRAETDAFLPDVIVNCAAYTNVDAAETDRGSAWAVNAEAPRYLAECAERCSVRLIHVSTDYVFDGALPRPSAYSETDTPHPCTVYGQSKLAGEKAVQDTMSDFVILRTAWLYGIGGRNFLKMMLRLSLQKPGELLKVVNDQYGSPTWSHRLALQIEAMLTDGQGVYHAVALGSCTWHELARDFLDAMGITHRLVPCSTEEYPTPAQRPANSVLENRRLEAEGLNRMRPWLEDVRAFATGHQEELLREAQPTHGR